MTDYTQTTDFSAKDALPTGNAAKVIKGSEMDTELAAISTAISTKAENATNETISGNWTHSGTTTFSNTVDLGGKATGADVDLLTTATASVDEYVTFASIFDDTIYNRYLFTWASVVPTTDENQLLFELGTGAGPTWIQGTAYTQAWGGQGGGIAGDGQQVGGNPAGFACINAMSTAANELMHGELIIYKPGASDNCVVYTKNWGVTSASGLVTYESVCNVSNTTAKTSIRFMMGVGSTHTAQTIASGEFRMYGYRDA